MSILVFSGTTEGRTISEALSEKGIYHYVSVATEYGEQVMTPSKYASVHVGRMDIAEMEKYFSNNSISIVVDATHPYATEVSLNIKEATQNKGAEYIRVLRKATDESSTSKASNNDSALFKRFKNTAACAQYLATTKGNILLTTGSKELLVFTEQISDLDRLYVRVLPGTESINKCLELNIKDRHVIAMQGPFSVAMNEAIIREFGIEYLVTKDSGAKGGYFEKSEAAQNAGIELLTIERPNAEAGYEVDEAIVYLLNYANKEDKLHISIAGAGMGNENTLTKEVNDAINKADVVFGAPRLINNIKKEKKYPFYLPTDIIGAINELSIDDKNILILMSGDTGMYSGAKALLAKMRECFSESKADIRVLPGISSVSFFSSKIEKPYNDALITSIHGVGDEEKKKVLNKVYESGRAFLLLSGIKDVKVVIERFIKNKSIILGYNLGCEDEDILVIDKKPEHDLCEKRSDGLYIAYLEDRVKEDKNINISKKRLLIAAPKSGSGKTLFTCGLLNLFKKSGMDITAFKCGPDYIDPMFHKRVLGVSSENIDSFFCDERMLSTVLNRRTSEYAIIEGVMGVYDGLRGLDLEASSYDVALKTDTPIVLLVDAHGTGRTLISTIKGIIGEDKHKLIKGIILNNISASFYELIKCQIEESIDVKVLGFLSKMTDVSFDSRHLGLVMPDEIEDILKKIDNVSENIEQHVDVDALISIMDESSVGENTLFSEKSRKSGTKVLAVAKDEAFCFYYEENLRILEEFGFRIEYFSPIHDMELPKDTECILLGGGYPELYLKELSDNKAMLTSIKEAIKCGVKSIAECGGFMYLHDIIKDRAGNEYRMVGAIEGETYYTDHLVRFGYVNVAIGNELIKGHEFHYYDSTNNGEDALVNKPMSTRTYKAMHIDEKRMWGFPHLYYGSNKKVLEFLNGSFI